MNMNISNIVEGMFFLIAFLIVIYAIVAFIYRLIKKKPFWPNFKRMIQLIFDGIMGAG